MRHGMSRRELLVAGGAGATLLAAGGYGISKLLAGDPPAGSSHELVVRATTGDVELGSKTATTWTYDGALPGRELRARQGEPVAVRLVNDLPEPTSIHWHGIRLENSMDGVPGMTQDPVDPGDEFVYEFVPPDAGTFFFHTHVGTQLDRGLYAPLVVEPRRERLSYESEQILMLDDWLDGIESNPDAKLAELQGSGMEGMDMGSGGDGSGGMDMEGMSMDVMRGGREHTGLDGGPAARGSLARLANDLERGALDPGDVPDYPLYLINGRPPEDPFQIVIGKGERMRLRLINPSADTIYCLFIEDHELEIVSADGNDVVPRRTDAILIGMGERYDALLDGRGGGASRVVAMPLGKQGVAAGYLRYRGSTGAAPPMNAPIEMPVRVASYGDLQPLDPASSSAGDPRVIRLDLGFDDPYSWSIGGQLFDGSDPIRVARGETVRFTMKNRTPMPHPMHLHGHSFTVGGPGGPLKDTALAIPRRELTLDWVADNPGVWAYHCHNVYHQESGMMRRVEVV